MDIITHKSIQEMGYMSDIYKRISVVLVLILAIILSWNETDPTKLNKEKPESYNRPLMSLSILPDEISHSLELLNRRAGDLQKDLKTRKGFTLNYFKLAGEKYISANTPLIVQTYYKKSNSLIQEFVSLPDNFAGLTISELKDIAKQWEIKDYSPGKVLILYRSIDEISPADINKMHLGVKGDKVAIFYGESGQRNLKKITEIRISDLPLQEQSNLKKGITINSNEELLSVLDGLISSVNRD